MRTICSDGEIRMQKIKELGYKLSSFDAYDAEKYGLNYTGQYFCLPPQSREPITCDCFFCGLPKDRADELEALRRLLEQNGLKCDFIIPRTPQEKVTYPEYLKRAEVCALFICLSVYASKSVVGKYPFVLARI